MRVFDFMKVPSIRRGCRYFSFRFDFAVRTSDFKARCLLTKSPGP